MPWMRMEQHELLTGESEPPPKHALSSSSDRDFIIDLWYRFHAMEKEMSLVREEARKTNGRITKLEKFMWLAMGVGMAATIFASSVAVGVNV